MKIILCILWVFTVFYANGQVMDWQTTHHWKMYQAASSKGLAISKEQLMNLPSVSMNDDSVHFFLQEVRMLPKQKYYVWMGAYYASCEVECVVCKIDLSAYGGFFYNECTKRYYELPMHIRNEWLNWLGRVKQKLGPLHPIP